MTMRNARAPTGTAMPVGAATTRYNSSARARRVNGSVAIAVSVLRTLGGSVAIALIRSLSAQASRRTSSHAPAPSTTAAYRQSMASPDHGDRM